MCVCVGSRHRDRYFNRTIEIDPHRVITAGVRMHLFNHLIVHRFDLWSFRTNPTISDVTIIFDECRISLAKTDNGNTDLSRVYLGMSRRGFFCFGWLVGCVCVCVLFFVRISLYVCPIKSNGNDRLLAHRMK